MFRCLAWMRRRLRNAFDVWDSHIRIGVTLECTATRRRQESRRPDWRRDRPAELANHRGRDRGHLCVEVCHQARPEFE